MKRICLIDFDMSKCGGVEQVAESLANEFSKQYDVHMVSLQFRNESTQYRFSECVKFTAFYDTSDRLLTMPIALYHKLKKYLVENKIEIVVLMGTYAAFSSLFVQLTTNVKFIFCDHGAIVNQLEDKKITMVRRIISKISDKTVALTKRTKEDYMDLFHLPEKKVTCIPNWMDETIFQYTKSYDLNSKKILSVGRFGKEKGYDMAMKVAKIVFENHPDWTWDIYGDGEIFEDIRKQVEKNGLKKNVNLKGNVQNIYELYPQYSMLVLPSYREGLPLVLLEAKANHLPCVSFDVLTGPCEIIRDGLNGYLIPMYDIEDMANKICLLIENTELRKKFSELSSMDEEKFSKNLILKQWVDIFEE